MNFKFLREFVVSSGRPEGEVHPIITCFLDRLGEHGEVQVCMASGVTFSMHLGDMGLVEGECIHFRDKEGQMWVLNAEQIEAIFTHLGYKE